MVAPNEDDDELDAYVYDDDYTGRLWAQNAYPSPNHGQWIQYCDDDHSGNDPLDDQN